jgi:hypothetical protein
MLHYRIGAMELSDVSAASLVMQLVHILRHQMAAAPQTKIQYRIQSNSVVYPDPYVPVLTNKA